MSSREKFEQAIKSRFGDSIDYRVCKNSDGEYMAWDMQVAWWAWQAAEADMAVQLANAESKCKELVAENAGLKNPDNWLSQSDYGYEASEVATKNGATEDESLRAGMVAIINRIGTPETDAFMAEMRASARVNFIDRIEWIIRNECNPDKTEVIISELQKFSDELKLEAAQ